MDFKKNQEVVVTIDDLGNEGEGIGHLDGYALFVKDALPGETVRVKLMKCKKNYGFAKLLEIAGYSISGCGPGGAEMPDRASVWRMYSSTSCI